MRRGYPHTTPISFIASKATSLKYKQGNKTENEARRNLVFFSVVGTISATGSILCVALQVYFLLLLGFVFVVAFILNNPVFLGIFVGKLSYRNKEIPGHHGQKDTRQTVVSVHDLLHPTCWTSVASN